MLAALVAACGVVTITSCKDEISTLGADIIDTDNTEGLTASYNVGVTNKKVTAFSANNLPFYQFGRYVDPIYGTTDAGIVSQLLLSTPNPSFGGLSQAKETTDGFNENETVTEVYLHLPFYIKAKLDTDGDGVPDDLEKPGKENEDDDYDGDGLTNAEEKAKGTNPYLVDTDSDGENDDVDTDTPQNIFAKTFDLDSIYNTSSIGLDLIKVKIKVEESLYFLSDFEPTSGFEDPKEYYSDFSTSFVGTVLNDENVELSISEVEELVFEALVDDPDTTDKDESTTVKRRLAPGLKVTLDAAFFQENFINKEGSDELFTANNFKSFLKGLVISANLDSAIMMGINIDAASLTVDYTYDVKDDDAKNSSYTFGLRSSGSSGYNGNVINTLTHTAPSSEVEQDGRILLKGGAGYITDLSLDYDVNDPVIMKIKNKEAILNEANLIFYVDSETLKEKGILNKNEPFRLYVYNTDTNLPLYNPTYDLVNTDDPQKSLLIYDGILEKNDAGEGVKYKVRITDYVNELLLEGADNIKLGLSLTSNINVFSNVNARIDGAGIEIIPQMSVVSPLGTVLFGDTSGLSADEESKQLKLTLRYTEIK